MIFLSRYLDKVPWPGNEGYLYLGHVFRVTLARYRVPFRYLARSNRYLVVRDLTLVDLP